MLAWLLPLETAGDKLTQLLSLGHSESCSAPVLGTLGGEAGLGNDRLRSQAVWKSWGFFPDLFSAALVFSSL